MYQNFIGIDISKETFTSALHGHNETKIFTNNQAGFSEFYLTYQRFFEHGLIVLETTGGYEMGCIRYLQAKQCSVHRANTRKVKHFIRSYGTLAKTDAIDAIGLAHYGFERQSQLELFTENPSKTLLKLVQRRNDLKHMLVQEKNRLQAPEQSELTQSFRAIINVLVEQMKAIETQIKQIMDSNPVLKEHQTVLKSVNGVGDIVAMQLLALLPELGTINRKKIASLAGLAPHPNESGKKIGYRFTRGGRTDVKPVLFMAAMAASRSHSVLGVFYQRLIAAGKKKMVALTALMRKILVIANARLRDYLTKNITLQHS